MNEFAAGKIWQLDEVAFLNVGIAIKNNGQIETFYEQQYHLRQEVP